MLLSWSFPIQKSCNPHPRSASNPWIFFAYQEDAKKRTVWLLVLYAAGVLLLVLCYAFFLELIVPSGYLPQHAPPLAFLASPYVFYGLPIFVFFLLFTGLFKYDSLRSGGKSVAESLSGTLVTPQTHAPLERRLLNIVEEMALASGIPVPPVYILEDETGINAFAAGYTINDAIIGVTQGALEQLNRDELQSVVAHEFSHILNGDMRLNLRFVALLFGLVYIMEAARLLIRSASRSSTRRSGKNSGKSALAMMLIALGLYLTGLLASFLGKTVQAAINRQREYLADASAVQFTRSTALASALKKIGGAAQGSQLSTKTAEEFSHLFFSRIDGGLFSTHPPLKERILRLEPDWDGAFIVPGSADTLANQSPNEKTHLQQSHILAPFLASGALTTDGLQEKKDSPINTAKHAEKILLETPEEALALLATSCQEPWDACYFIFALLLDANPSIQQKQLQQLEHSERVRTYAHALELLPVNAYIPLIEKAIPALKTLSSEQYTAFSAMMHQFIHADAIVSFKEWILFELVTHQVGGQYKKRTLPGIRFKSLQHVLPALSILLSSLARLETKRTAAQQAFTAGWQTLGLPERFLSAPAESQELSEALALLQQSTLIVRKKFLLAAEKVVIEDEAVTLEETMFLHAMSLCLDCPASTLPTLASSEKKVPAKESSTL